MAITNTSTPITEGFAPYHVTNAGKPCQTWYKIVGSLDSCPFPPLVCLHGGPGGDHRPMVEPFMPLWDKLGIPLIFYDQLGAGNSTHLPEKNGDTAFWSLELFLDELRNLVSHLGLEKRQDGFSLFGQSWGGMLACAYAATCPRGLAKVINSSGPSSMPLYMEGVRELIKGLPLDVQKAIEECERVGDTTSDKFQAAEMVWIKKHLYRTEGEFPEAIKDMLEDVKKDPTVYMTMCGPSEFQITGSMKDMVLWQDAHQIEVPVLILNGRYDEVMDRCLDPWFKEIPNVKWIQLDNSSHLGMYEEQERFAELLGKFLTT
ncbi:Alpha/Beta hydrolase fold [Rhypophila decipiens]